MKNKIQTPTTVDTVNTFTLEVITEGAKPYQKLLEKARKVKPGSRRHRDLLCELWTMASVIEVKAREAGIVIDEYLDSLPEDDD